MTVQIETFIRGVHARPFTKELNAYGGVLGAEWDYGGKLTAAVSSLTVDQWPIKIADISYWQSDIDFAKMATQVQAVIIRSVYGNKYIDPRLDEYYTKATDNGLKVMLYHYMKPANNWQVHADTLIQVDKDYPNLYLWGDLEETGGKNKQDLESWIYKYFNRVREYKEKIGIYSSKGFLDSSLGLTNWLKWMDLWLAAWTTASSPAMPNEWITNPDKPRTWKLWQWTSKGDGALHGVSSRYIDLNRYNGSIADFNNYYNTNIQPLPGSEPPPDPDPTEENIMLWYVKATTTPLLNVRATPGGVDVGDLLPGAQFKVKNIVYASNGAWAQIAEGQYLDKWACLHNSSARYCEPVGM